MIKQLQLNLYDKTHWSWNFIIPDYRFTFSCVLTGALSENVKNEVQLVKS